MSIDYSIIERELFCPRFGSSSVGEIRAIVFAAYMSQFSAGSEPSNYQIGRKLGLTETQVKNLRVKANLLLEDEDETRDRARLAFASSVKSGSLEYQEQKQRIAVQIDDAVAVNYLAAIFSEKSIFRDSDFSNGHIAVPVSQFGQLLEELFPEIDLSLIEKNFRASNSEFDEAEPESESSLFKGLQKWLPVIDHATSIVSNLAGTITPFLGM